MFILGMGHDSGSAEMEMADILQTEIQKEFVISPLLMLPVLFLLLAIIVKIPALPAIFCGVLMGMFCMGVVQELISVISSPSCTTVMGRRALFLSLTITL